MEWDINTFKHGNLAPCVSKWQWNHHCIWFNIFAMWWLHLKNLKTILQYLICTKHGPSFRKIQTSTHKWTTQSQYELYCRNEKNIKNENSIITVFFFLTSLKQDINKQNIYLCLFLNFGDKKSCRLFVLIESIFSDISSPLFGSDLIIIYLFKKATIFKF